MSGPIKLYSWEHKRNTLAAGCPSGDPEIEWRLWRRWLVAQTNEMLSGTGYIGPERGAGQANLYSFIWHYKLDALGQEANYKGALKRLEAINADGVRELVFGHWGSDFRVLQIALTRDLVIEAARMIQSLEQYPFIDDEIYSELESDYVNEYWLDVVKHNLENELDDHESDAITGWMLDDEAEQAWLEAKKVWSANGVSWQPGGGVEGGQFTEALAELTQAIQAWLTRQGGSVPPPLKLWQPQPELPPGFES